MDAVPVELRRGTFLLRDQTSRQLPHIEVTNNEAQAIGCLQPVETSLFPVLAMSGTLPQTFFHRSNYIFNFPFLSDRTSVFVYSRISLLPWTPRSVDH